jgi:hypothetical protein
MALLLKDDTLRTAVGTAGVFTALVVFTGYTLRSLAPVVILSVGMLVYNAADEAYDLPDGTNGIAYGLGLIAVGGFVALRYATRFGGIVLLAGLWFVLDGATTVRYGPTRTPHQFVTGPESEAMLRMRILNTVYRRLRAADDARTPEDLADACDLTESRVTSTLDYLEHRGQVERAEDGYRAVPQRWGRATPVAQFAAWLSRRLLRPLDRLRTGG